MTFRTPSTHVHLLLLHIEDLYYVWYDACECPHKVRKKCVNVTTMMNVEVKQRCDELIKRS